MPNRNDSWRHPNAPADDAPRSAHEAYAKNPRAHGYAGYKNTIGEWHELPTDFAFFWLPCRHCGKIIGGHEAHREYLGDPLRATDDYRCMPIT